VVGRTKRGRERRRLDVERRRRRSRSLLSEELDGSERKDTRRRTWYGVLVRRMEDG